METSGEPVFKYRRMTVQKTTSSSPLYDISSWTSAFLVYMNIVLEKQITRIVEIYARYSTCFQPVPIPKFLG